MLHVTKSYAQQSNCHRNWQLNDKIISTWEFRAIIITIIHKKHIYTIEIILMACSRAIATLAYRRWWMGILSLLSPPSDGCPSQILLPMANVLLRLRCQSNAECKIIKIIRWQFASIRSILMHSTFQTFFSVEPISYFWLLLHRIIASSEILVEEFIDSPQRASPICRLKNKNDDGGEGEEREENNIHIFHIL